MKRTSTSFWQILAPLFLLLLVPANTHAISVDKLQYTPGETVNVTCSYHYEMYDITTGIDGVVANGGDLGSFDCSVPASLTFSAGTSSHTYALVEGYNDACSGQDYGACNANVFGNLVGSTQFTVGDSSIDKPPPDTGGGGGTPPAEGPDKSVYEEGDPIGFYCSNPDTQLEVYDVTSGIDGVASNGGDMGTFQCGQPATFNFNSTANHSYAVLEVGNSACAGNDFDACRANVYGNFSGGEFHFQMIVKPDRRTGIISYPPLVQVLTPKAGSIFSHTGTITYKVTDQNDLADLDQKTKLGLGATPISIYYTDKIGDWDHTYIDPSDKILIAQNLPNTGSYTWNIKDGDLQLGHPYKIIVDATDNAGLLTEDVSDFFTVDFSAPQFIVSTDPAATRGEDVKIIIDATKNLNAAPNVTVTQQGGAAVPVTMQGSKDHYEGIYKVIQGEDGIASIQVQGTDLAGNTGSEIVSGGTFAVGINPPPKPKILAPANNATVSSSTITVRGTSRIDTIVLLKINGTTYTASTSPDGSFVIPNIVLSKSQNRGVNILSIQAKDKSGTLSEAVPLSVKYNIAPTVSIKSPQDGTIISTGATFDLDAADANADPLHFTYQIIAIKDYNPALASSGVASTTDKNPWVVIGEDLPVAHFAWDSTEVEDGEYLVRAIADDGTVKVASAPIDVRVKNTLPAFKFEDGRKTLSATTSATLTGRVITPETISPRPNVAKIEYSDDAGRHWKTVAMVSGIGTPEAHFSVTVSNLHEGTQALLWRAKDSRGLIGRTSHPIIVDHTAPDAPTVSFPRSGSILGDESDEDRAQSGLQTEIKGEAEAESTVTLSGIGTSQSVKAGIDGTFIFRNVTLTRGLHDFTLIATDESGNVSAPTISHVTYDNAPEISFLEPKPSRGLEGVAKVSWRVSDADNDAVFVTSLAYRRGNSAFTELPVDPTSSTFTWDVSKFPEAGDYELRIVATDGIATTTETDGFYIDKTPPTLNSFTLTSAAVGKSGIIEGSGTASDALSGIEFVEYAITPLPVGPETKKEWYTGIITKGYLRKSAAFSIKTPVSLTDGHYEIAVRAVDAAGNISNESSQEIVVDTTPPRIGSFTEIFDDTQFSPDKDGELNAYADTDIVLGVSLEDDTASASLSVQGNTYMLTHDIVSGLWKSKVHLEGEGRIPVLISAADRLGNAIQNISLGHISTVERGKVVINTKDGIEPLADARVQILKLNEKTSHYEAVSADVRTREDGSYETILGAGSYKLVIKEDGYKTVAEELVLDRPTLVHATFTTEKISTLQQFVQNISDYFTYAL